MATTDFIEIDLDAAQDGVVPTIRDNLHDEDLKRAVDLIRRLARPAYEKRRAQLQPATLRPATRAQLPTRRGLLIEGERGIGKTSFLLALSATFNDEKTSRLDQNPAEPRVHALPLIDPSLISGDRTFIATVIANVLSEVERCTNPQPQLCDPRQRSARAELDKAVQGLHDGLLAESEDTWRGLTSNRQADGQFVDHLLRAARGGLSLADRFEAFTRLAADMLGADMLLQPLDDVDLAGPEAYTTLEAVRRYMTGPSLLPVVAGDLEQFISMIWERRLQDEERGLKARPEKELGGAAARRAELRRVAGQHIDKLLPPHHRFPLPNRKAEVLRRGKVKDAKGSDLPVLGWTEGEPAPAKGSSLIGQAEAMLAPGPGRLVSGALLPLIPENTRAMFSALRLLRDSIPEAALTGTQRRAAAVEALERLGHLFAADLVGVGLRPAHLRRLAELGPEDEAVTALQATWMAQAATSRPSPSMSSVEDRVPTLLYIALAQWLATQPTRALVLLGLHAPYLAPLHDGRQVRLRPSVVLRGAPVAEAVARTAHRPVEGGKVKASELPWRASTGFWLRMPSRTTSAYHTALLSYLGDDASGYVDLIPYLSVRQRELNKRPTTNSALFLTRFQVTDRWRRADAAALLVLARTSLLTDAGDTWIVDPRRILEVLARAACTLRNDPQFGTATSTDSVGAVLRSVFSPLDQVELDAPPRRASLHPKPVPLRADWAKWVEALSQQLISWLSAPLETPSIGSTILTYQRWTAALANIADCYSGRLATVGGYLQRSVLALFAAAIEAEVTQIGGLGNLRRAGPAFDDTSWDIAASTGNDYTVYSADLSDHHIFGAEFDLEPQGRLHSLLQLLRERLADLPLPGRDAVVRKSLPCSTMLVTCPLLICYIAKPWLTSLSTVWTLPETPTDPDLPDAHTLLSAIVVLPNEDRNHYPTVEWVEKTLGKGLLSATERQTLTKLNEAAPTP
jgi:hypothetical protein